MRLEFNDWARAGRGAGMEKGHRPVGEQAIELMGIPADARVLDVGCGSGWATRLMAEKARDGRVVGIDIADEMIKLAREELQARFRTSNFRWPAPRNFRLPAASLATRSRWSRSITTLTCCVALEEIKRVLEPGGSSLPSSISIRRTRRHDQWVEQLKVPVQFLSIAQYRSLFERAGFVNVLDRRLYDPAPIPADYRAALSRRAKIIVDYRAAGSLMIERGGSRVTPALIPGNANC